MDFIATDKAPAAIGPYSQAVQAGDWLFCSGQIGINPASGEMEADLESQMRRCFSNLRAVLAAAGLTHQDVVKVTLYLTDMGNFAQVNTIYGDFFGTHKPARATVAVSGLPKNALVELDAIALIHDES